MVGERPTDDPFELPADGEWERAARGAGGRTWPWGADLPSCRVAVMGGDGCGSGGTAPVCSRPAGNSPDGLCDLAGNVAEWLEDAYVGTAGSARTVRGGSYRDLGKHLRGDSRAGAAREHAGSDVGFRCASGEAP